MQGEQIKKYKVLLSILVQNMEDFTKSELDDFLKHSVGLEGSCKGFDKEQMNNLIESTYYLATQIGLEIDDNEQIHSKKT